MGKRRLTVAKAKEALMLNDGILAAAARSLNCHRHTLRGFIEENPELQEVREQALEIVLDQAEKNFYSAVNAGDLYASKFVLERKGRSRGWAPTPLVSNSAQFVVPFTIIERVRPFERTIDGEIIIDGEAVELKQIGSSGSE